MTNEAEKATEMTPEQAVIKLTRGYEAIVGIEDFEVLSKYKWHYSKGYARRTITGNGKQTTEFMHKALNHTPNGFHTDHINGNKLDNRKENLRTCTAQENGANCKKKIGSSRFKGVRRHGLFMRTGKQRWAACIRRGGKRKHLGYFDCEITAAKAYDVAARKYSNIETHLNFPLKEAN